MRSGAIDIRLGLSFQRWSQVNEGIATCCITRHEGKAGAVVVRIRRKYHDPGQVVNDVVGDAFRQLDQRLRSFWADIKVAIDAVSERVEKRVRRHQSFSSRRRRSAASTQTVASAAKMLMFPQTSSSSS